MKFRNLSSDEWVGFFNSFSRRYRGRLVTVDVGKAGAGEGASTVARRTPLNGITAESVDGRVKAIEIMLGDSPDEHLTHMVNAPTRVTIGQVQNGEDDLLVIESATDPVTRVHFPPASTLAEDTAAKLGRVPGEPSEVF